MKPATSVQKNSAYKISQVEMKLEAITLKQLTSFLYRIELSENMVFVKRISISKTDKPKGSVTTVLQAETFEI